jgi:4'-phosphopantetheinyl transferase
MIYYLVASANDHPELKSGSHPEDLLGEVEITQLSRLKVPKRRQDWLLGRWTAKHAVQAVVYQETGWRLALKDITILYEPSGAPYVNLDRLPEALTISISISHSGDIALCAAAVQRCHASYADHSTEGQAWKSILRPPGASARTLLGADIERIESRPAGFIEDYFTDTERALVECADPALRTVLITAIWSGKEAALKALRLGLRVDTRSVTCRFDPEEGGGTGWQPFLIQWDSERLEPVLESLEDYAHDKIILPRLTGWWQHQAGSILTLAVDRNIYPFPVLIRQTASGDLLR